MATTQEPIRFRLEPGAFEPSQGRPGDAAYDLTVISVKVDETIPGNRVYTFDTGVSVQPPATKPGYEIHSLLVLRSSMQGSGWMMAGGCPGVIDGSYRGTVRIKLRKVSEGVPDLVLPARICQLVFYRGVGLAMERAEELDRTERGTGGFGSTNK